MSLFASAQPPSTGRMPHRVLIICLSLIAMIVGCTTLLWPEWSSNPDLSHGFFAPLIFALLVWESRRIGPQRWVKSGRSAHLLLILCMAAGFLCFALAGLFAASLAWSHAVVLFLLTVSLASFLLGGLLLLADEQLRLLPFNWINLTAIMLWVLVAPVPPGTYANITLTLQGWVSSGVMNVLQFFGVPARQHGNVIELARTTVGVEEACSGVRSLLSCVFAGFFFAAWQVRAPFRRVLLILAAPVLALGMNFLRSLSLTLLANEGVDISGTWHDATGFAILGVTAILLAGLAMLLETKSPEAVPAATASTSSPASQPAFATYWVGLVLTFSLAGFFYYNSRPSDQPVTSPPDLTTFLPGEVPGWHSTTPDDLYRFSDVLETTHLLQRTYVRPAENRRVVQLTVYVAYWAPGQTTVSRVASHTPDACWPGSGWSAETEADDRIQIATLPGLPLAPAEHRIFGNAAGFTQHVWFWHLFGGRAIDHRDPYSLPALLKNALQYGFRRQGSQYFIRVSSNRPWHEIAQEPLLREILAKFHQVGL